MVIGVLTAIGAIPIIGVILAMAVEGCACDAVLVLSRDDSLPNDKVFSGGVRFHSPFRQGRL